MDRIRRAAVAGSWYPADPAALAREVDRYLEAADTWPPGDVAAVIAPHAGLKYSGPVGAHAYHGLRGTPYEVAVLLGPSHYVGFAGAYLWRRGAFETPFGLVAVAEGCADDIAAASDEIVDLPEAHAREHSLEMQLPFLARVLPGIEIVPIVMGYQTRAAAFALGEAVAAGIGSRRALIIASTDLSHFHDARTAARLDAQVIRQVEAFSADGLMAALEAFPGHACGGGPAVAAMHAARTRGAVHSQLLAYGDSGDVSGDKSSVVGYMAAAVGTFEGRG